MQPKLRGAFQHDFGMESGEEDGKWSRPRRARALSPLIAFCAIAALVLTLYSCRSHHAVAPTHFSLFTGEESLALRGSWEFHAGDLPPDNLSDGRNGLWQIRPVPSFWSQIGSPSTGIA